MRPEPGERWAGEVHRARSRATGTVVVLLDLNNGGAWAGTPDEGGRWMLVCADHGRLVQVETRRLAAWHAPDVGWCGVCSGVEPAD